jgi:hypothetical protein
MLTFQPNFMQNKVNIIMDVLVCEDRMPLTKYFGVINIAQQPVGSDVIASSMRPMTLSYRVSSKVSSRVSSREDTLPILFIYRKLYSLPSNHTMLACHVIFPSFHPESSSSSNHTMLLSNVIFPCYHPVYQLMLSSHIIMSCNHLMLPLMKSPFLKLYSLSKEAEF